MSLDPDDQAGRAHDSATAGWPGLVGQFNRRAEVLADIVVSVALLGELLVVLVTVVGRALFGDSLTWGQEVAHIALTVITFIGGALAYRRNYQLSLEAVTKRLPPGWQQVVQTSTDWIIVSVSLMVAVASWPLLSEGWEQRTPILQIAHSWLVLPLTVGMVLFAMQALENLARRPGTVLLSTGLGLAVLVTLAIISRPLWGHWMQGPHIIELVLCLFLILLVFGLPIAFALVVGAVLFMFTTGLGSMVVLPRQMDDAVGNFILLSIPFFVLAGLIMAYGGLGSRIANFVNALIGHVRSGPLQVMIVSMYIFSGLSGSKVADMAAVGTTMSDMARQRGYARGEIAAILAASAVMGETVPPSIAILVLGSVTTLSIASLFVAGILPAVVLAIAIMGLAYYRARRSGMVTTMRAPAKVILSTSLHAILPLMLPVILVGGVLSGIATPTEISAAAVVFGAILAGLVYREADRAVFVRTLTETTVMSGMILFIVSAAAPFTWSMAIARVPDAVAMVVAAAGNERWLFLLGTIVALIVMGSLLESVPALIIFGPLLLPIATQIGINPLQYGIVLIISMGWGAFAPPIGVGMYVACVITRATVEEVTQQLLPYLGILLLAIVLVALVPGISTGLPSLFGLGN